MCMKHSLSLADNFAIHIDSHRFPTTGGHVFRNVALKVTVQQLVFSQILVKFLEPFNYGCNKRNETVKQECQNTT